jgi:hypothetical protein
MIVTCWRPLLITFLVADVPDAETEYHAHEFVDVTVQPKPVYISPNEIYAMHGILTQNADRVVCRHKCCRLHMFN